MTIPTTHTHTHTRRPDKNRHVHLAQARRLARHMPPPETATACRFACQDRICPIGWRLPACLCGRRRLCLALSTLQPSSFADLDVPNYPGSTSRRSFDDIEHLPSSLDRLAADSVTRLGISHGLRRNPVRTSECSYDEKTGPAPQARGTATSPGTAAKLSHPPLNLEQDAIATNNPITIPIRPRSPQPGPCSCQRVSTTRPQPTATVRRAQQEIEIRAGPRDRGRAPPTYTGISQRGVWGVGRG